MAMSLTPVLALLVLLAAVTHASWNAIAKGSRDKTAVFALAQAVGIVIGAAAAVLMPLPAAAAWPYLIASAIIHNGYFFSLMRAYENGDLSHVYPVARGSAPLLVAALTAALAIETPSPGGLAGIALTSAGIASLAFMRGSAPGAGFKPAALALITGLTITAYTICDGLGARASGSGVAYAFWLFVLSGLPFCAVTAWARRATLARDVRAVLLPGIVAGVLCIIGYTIVLYAMTQGALAYVSALRETSVLFAALIGTLGFREPFGIRRIGAASVIAAGLIVLQTAG